MCVYPALLTFLLLARNARMCLERKIALLLVSHGGSGMMADGEERDKSKDFSHRLIKHKFMYSRKNRLKTKMVLFFIIGARTHVHGC